MEKVLTIIEWSDNTVWVSTVLSGGKDGERFETSGSITGTFHNAYFSENDGLSMTDNARNALLRWRHRHTTPEGENFIWEQRWDDACVPINKVTEFFDSE